MYYYNLTLGLFIHPWIQPDSQGNKCLYLQCVSILLSREHSKCNVDIFKCLTCCSFRLVSNEETDQSRLNSSISACGAMSVRELHRTHTLLSDWMKIQHNEVVL